MVNMSDGDARRSASLVPATGVTFEVMARHPLDFRLTSEDLQIPRTVGMRMGAFRLQEYAAALL